MNLIVNMPALQLILMAIIFLSIMIEIKTGGLGIGALLGLVAAAIFWGSSYVNGLVSIYQIALFLGGILLIIIELITPATGILAAIGIFMMLYSMMLALGGNISAIYMLLGSFIIAIIIFILILKYLPSSKLWKKVVLQNSSTVEQGYTSTTNQSSLLNREGIVLTELHPAGTILIDEQPIDVVSEGVYISKGSSVRIIKIDGSRIIVRKI